MRLTAMRPQWYLLESIDANRSARADRFLIIRPSLMRINRSAETLRRSSLG
jgi:hypothetical protein